jgi:hypothetical protein
VGFYHDDDNEEEEEEEEEREERVEVLVVVLMPSRAVVFFLRSPLFVSRALFLSLFFSLLLLSAHKVVTRHGRSRERERKKHKQRADGARKKERRGTTTEKSCQCTPINEVYLPRVVSPYLALEHPAQEAMDDEAQGPLEQPL